MPLWKRLLITLAAMVAVSFIAGLAWQALFQAGMPSYLAGIIGGMTALPVWEFLKQNRHRGR